MSQIQAEGVGRSLSLFDMVDRILDKGLIIDAYVSVSIVGIELLVIRARLVVASLETYLRYASAMGLYGEPGGVVQKGASPKEMGSKKGELPKQEQQGQQQPQQGQQQLQQLLQQLGQLGQQPLQQATKPLQQVQQK
jgi:gas vesicle structural protein